MKKYSLNLYCLQHFFYNIVHSDCDRYCIIVNKETGRHSLSGSFFIRLAVFLIKKVLHLFKKSQRWSVCLEAGGMGHLEKLGNQAALMGGRWGGGRG